MYNGVEVMEKNGKVAVLVSHGYGAGWSTWNDPKIAYDKRVVEFFDNHPPKLSVPELEEAEKHMEEIGYPDTYMGGYNKLEKEWIPVGQPFIIIEDDGAEYIPDMKKYIVFK